MSIKRGHIYTADLNPRRGTEPGKIRPVVVIQTNLINNSHPSTIVCPLTTKIKPPVEILRAHLSKGEGGLKEASDLLIDQVRAVDNQRIQKELGALSPHRMAEIEEKILVLLDLSN